MDVIKDPVTGTTVITQDGEKLKKILEARHKFNQEYCLKKGWHTDYTKLSIQQIMEIREQPEWINAGKKD